jgi:predicted DsbA family dithiol-disulfide isomerase
MDLARLHPNQGKSDMGSYILKFAAGFGIHDIKPSARLPNTRRPLAAAEYARSQGKLDAFRSLVMDAHWKEGKNIEDEAVLRQLAAAAGLDPDKAIKASVDPAYSQRVAATRVEYKKLGVGGIPTFIIGSEIVEGCQPYEILADAAHRAGARNIVS